MPDLQPEVLRDALIMNALDKTRSDIADYVNAEHGTSHGTTAISNAINAVEAEADAGDPRAVFEHYHMRGYGADMGEDLSEMFALVAGSSQ